jgi:hypothetical protein
VEPVRLLPNGFGPPADLSGSRPLVWHSGAAMKITRLGLSSFHQRRATSQTIRMGANPPSRIAAQSGKSSPRVSVANGVTNRPRVNAIAVKATGVPRVPMAATAPARPKFAPAPTKRPTEVQKANEAVAHAEGYRKTAAGNERDVRGNRSLFRSASRKVVSEVGHQRLHATSGHSEICMRPSSTGATDR